MSGKESKEEVPQVLSWQQKEERADTDEIAIEKEVEELISWTTMIQTTNDKQLMESLMSRPQNAKAGKIAQAKKARRGGKPTSRDNGVGLEISQRGRRGSCCVCSNWK